MNCRKVQNSISAYIDSELTGTEMLMIRDHINNCVTCNQEYRSLLRLKRSFGRMSSKQCPNDLTNRIYNAIAYEPEKRSRKTIKFPQPNLGLTTAKFRYAAMGAGVLCMLILLASGSMKTDTHRNTSEYHMELSSLINDDQNTFAGFHGEKTSPSLTNNIRNDRRFNMPWGLSNKAVNTPLLSHDTQMVLASY